MNVDSEDSEPASVTTTNPDSFRWPKFLANALAGWLFTWLGIALAGGMFGTCLFPIVGTIIGFILAGMAGGFTSLLGICLHVAMRGRLPLRISANFAGAAAGFTSWGGIGSGDVASPSRETLGFQVVTTQLGSLGAVIATAIVLRLIGRTRLGNAARPWQFSILDLLVFTTWFALVLMAYRVWAGPELLNDNSEMYVATLVLSAMAITELLSWLYRRLLLKPTTAK
ncbi:MAG: hypothetical protein AAGD11_13245 [Planctomycetota bacterium]